ncbi:hypothetical protein IQ249_06190 [Lusitaniella coriacea LEGE 07157]|uniref:Uncharacterized protein n=1 Tax=Lusitaniella coriacea LEGE 07157 TaxID=945747 RepID=A0A8J7B7R8_9CYAN|nr:hypothetical protein [Lusitaniella coriacea]MBE9115486.1 hypothetical protein [Lusitaniella coriacea LEGE 07157]
MFEGIFNTKRIAKQVFQIGIFASVGISLFGATPLRASEASFADGTYLYGQSPQAEQIDREYLVFQVRDGQVTGAAYYPLSEFACFTGQIDETQLSLSVVDPYEDVAHPYAIALESESQTASSNSQVPVPLQLEGFHRLETLSDNDLRLLNACQG